MDADPKITCVPGFPELHDFEPYGFSVDFERSELTMQLKGHVVRDATATTWQHDEVFIQARFHPVRAYQFDHVIFSQQNVLFAVRMIEAAEAQRQGIVSEVGEDWLDITRVFVLEASVGLSGYVAADEVEYSERSTRWIAA